MNMLLSFSRCPPLPSAWLALSRGLYGAGVAWFAVFICGPCSSLLPGRLPGGCFDFFGGSPDAGVEGRCPHLRMAPLPQRTRVTGGKQHLHVPLHIQTVQQHTQNRCSFGVFLIGRKYYDIFEASDRDVPGEIPVPCCC